MPAWTLLWSLLGCTNAAPRAQGPVAARQEAPAWPICINELMPSNQAAIFDVAGEADDWIELFNTGAEDFSLAGWTLTDDRAVPDKVALDPGLVVPAGGALLLWADGSPEQGTDHLPIELAAAGEELGLYDPEGNGSLVDFGRVHDDFALARDGDCCTAEGCWTFDFRGTPGQTNHPPVAVDETVLPLGSTWSYRDDGGPVDPSWITPGFDDSAWSSGPAPLGYGDKHLATVLSYGPDAAAKHVTTWFRRRLDLAEVEGLSGARVLLMRDDGARVFLNGTEIARSNLPEGELLAETLASTSASGADETTTWSIAFDPALLVAGENLLAVEVHQATVESSDLGMDLSVILTRLGPSD